MKAKHLKVLTIATAVAGILVSGTLGWGTLQSGQEGTIAAINLRVAKSDLQVQKQRAATEDALGVAGDVAGSRLMMQLSTRIEMIARENALKLYSLNVDPLTKPVDTGKEDAMQNKAWANYEVGFSFEGDVRQAYRAIAAISQLETPIRVDEVQMNAKSQPGSNAQTVTTVRLSVLAKTGAQG